MPQSYVCLPTHIIFSTKHRLPMIQTEWEPRLYEYIGGILRKDGCVLLAAGGMADHLHLLISLGKERAIADLVRDIKANSSRWIHETFADQHAFAWQGGYGAFAVSHSNLDKVRLHIANQKEHHRKMTFQEELIAFLKRHGIGYDEQYVWNE